MDLTLVSNTPLSTNHKRVRTLTRSAVAHVYEDQDAIFRPYMIGSRDLPNTGAIFLHLAAASAPRFY
jgi:hypothetical protein